MISWSGCLGGLTVSQRKSSIRASVLTWNPSFWV
jgi:hypothetical protein